MAEAGQGDFLSQLTAATSTGHLVQLVAEILHDSDLFYGHGTDNPDDEAYSLVFSVLDIPFDEAESRWEQPLAEQAVEHVVEVLDKRINQRIPLPYLTGVAWFAGLPFVIDERALIPRSPFAELILEHFQPWLDYEQPIRVLDMCTGNGCIGIAIAHHMPDATVDIVDISADALQLAKQNVAQHQVGDRVEVIQSDLFEVIAGRQYDLIVSNPPYVPASSMQDLPVEYRHEPVMALQADNEGMVIVDRMLRQASDYLIDEGLLIIEVGEIWEAVEQAYNLPFVWLEFEHGGEGVFLLHKQDLQFLNN